MAANRKSIYRGPHDGLHGRGLATQRGVHGNGFWLGPERPPGHTVPATTSPTRNTSPAGSGPDHALSVGDPPLAAEAAPAPGAPTRLR